MSADDATFVLVTLLVACILVFGAWVLLKLLSRVSIATWNSLYQLWQELCDIWDATKIHDEH